MPLEQPQRSRRLAVRLLQAVLPPLLSLPLSLLYALRLIRPKFSFRLFAEGLLNG